MIASVLVLDNRKVIIASVFNFPAAVVDFLQLKAVVIGSIGAFVVFGIVLIPAILVVVIVAYGFLGEIKTKDQIRNAVSIVRLITFLSSHSD